MKENNDYSIGTSKDNFRICEKKIDCNTADSSRTIYFSDLNISTFKNQ